MKNLILYVALCLNWAAHASETITVEDFKKVTVSPGETVQFEATLPVDTCNRHQFGSSLRLLEETWSGQLYELKFGISSTRSTLSTRMGCRDFKTRDLEVKTQVFENEGHFAMQIFVPAFFSVVNTPSN